MKMTTYSFTCTNSTISLVENETGKYHVVSNSHPNFAEIKNALSEQNWEKISELLILEDRIATLSGEKFRLINHQIEVEVDLNSWWKVPDALNETILQYIKDKLPFDRLIKFAINLSKNPSYRSVQQLFSFIQANGLVITENGCFIAYKGVTQDFKDCHTGTFDNSVGTVVKLERNKVDDNPEQTCSYGLHVANHGYAHNHYGHGSQGITVLVEVNPADVVSVPIDYNSSKMRVCQYRVLKVSPDPVSSMTYDTCVEDDSDESDCDDGSPCDEPGCSLCNEDEESDFEDDNEDSCPECHTPY